MKYRPDVDGLRAVAVLAVVGFHAFPAWFQGGFVGVDVFFVISGFLISGIIFSSLDNGRFSFRDFYARRIRRIFPSLVIVLAAALAAGWFLLYADRYAELGKHTAGGAGFVANFVLWREAGYFDGASDTKLLLHLWSLGVEEQFYLIWPLLAWLAWKARRDLLALTVLVFLVSMYFNLDRIRRDLIGTFYAPHTRFWELMAGAMLAHLSTLPSARSVLAGARRLYVRTTDGEGARMVMSLAGAGLLAASIWGIDQSRHFPGRWAVPPVAGAVLVIAAGPRAVVNRLLATRVMVGIGLISYPLYLWHWPILSFLRTLNGETPPPSVRALAVISSVALAWLTYVVVERPIRFGPRRAVVVPVLCVLLASIGGAGYYAFVHDGLWSRAVNRSDKAPFLAYYQQMRKKGIDRPYRLECDFMERGPDTVKDHIAPECTVPGAQHTWFLWGDSHAQALSAGITSVMPAGTALAQVATSGCRPGITDDDQGVAGGRCLKANAYALERIRVLRPEVLILAMQGGYDTIDWDRFAQAMRQAGVGRIVLAGPLPIWIPSLPEIVTSRYWGEAFDRLSYGVAPDRAELDRQLQQRFSGSSPIAYASIISHVCDSSGCLAVVPGSQPPELMAFDSAHLTPLASRYVADVALRPVLSAR